MNKKISKKGLIIAAICVTATAAALISFGLRDKDNVKYVTDDDINEYRKNIGEDLDVKKAIVIFFDTKMEADEFIKNHGDSSEPQNLGIGAVPYMEDGYYNIVGKPVLEEVFDTLSDGEYTKEPIEYSGVWCYIKRLEIQKPTDEEIKEMIKQEQAVKKGS